MKKIKLYSIGNRGKFNYYVFGRTGNTLDLIKLLNISFNVYIDCHKEYENGDHNHRRIKINFEKLKDKYISTSSKCANIHLFFGEKKLFVTIDCTHAKRLKFNEELFKISKMPNPVVSKKKGDKK